MREIWQLAWARFNVLTLIVGDVQGRVIATLFYFTILVPFGILSRLTGDPLHRKALPDGASYWQSRHPVPTDLDAARRQG